MKKVAIIGAGISGLFIANLFKKNTDYQIAGKPGTTVLKCSFWWLNVL